MEKEPEFHLRVKAENRKYSKEIEKKFLQDLAKSCTIYHQELKTKTQIKICFQNEIFKKKLEDLSINQSQAINKAWRNILNKVLPRTKQNKLLAIADLWPRNTPFQLLAYLVSRTDRRIFIEDILVLWINHQNRCLRYFEDKNDNALTKELRNLPHENWSPTERL